MTSRDTPVGHPSPSWEGSIGAHFREQAALRPHAVAVVDGDERLTYAELDERATAVARGLAARGVRPETLVGMAYDRSAEAVVAMLGIVLAHGAYVPVNPALPRRRVERIVLDAGLGLVLCAGAERDRIAALLPPGITVLDTAEAVGTGTPEGVGIREDADASQPEPHGSPLAYVMFTSGSTGRPKGVMVEHRGVLRLVKDTDYVDLGPDTRFLHGAALEFDASTLETWGTLLNGGTLYVADRETMLVPWRYARALSTAGITTAWLTAPLFHRMAEEDPGIFAPLRTLLTGGDVVSPGHVRAVLAHNPGLRLLNGYGPTENTTFTTVHTVRAASDRPVPIGRPIPGTTVLVCDEHGRPVPNGTIGELYTAGAGLARGYLGMPDLTRERFVTVDGQRHYRTGDRVSRTPEGLLHFHGRTDDQVKISGNLVVLSEVTAALREIPGVTDACTRAVERPDGERRLVAYLVAPGADDDSVHTALAAALPSYMCPGQLVRVDALPVNENGKVDWRILPEQGPDSRPGRAASPLTVPQAELAELWAQVLEVPAGTIGPGDDFFALGGDSIRLGRLVGWIARACGVLLPLADALAARTLAAMSEAVRTQVAGPYRPISARITGTANLHPHQRGLYALWQADPDSLAYNIPVRVDIRGPLAPDRLRDALQAVVRRHDALRMRFVVDGGTVRQEAADDVEPSFAYREAEPGATAIGDFVRPFAADRPPHLRALLVRTGPDRHELYLDAHHAVLDGVSLRVLVDEVFDLCTGRPSAAPPLPYAAAAQWCHDRLGTDEGRADEAYWLSRLAGLPASALPTNHPRGPRRAVRGAVALRALDARRTEALRTVAGRHRTTLYSVLLAGYVTALARLTGQDDLVVGSPLSGRTHPDLDAVVGMFVATVCLRTRTSEDTTLAELIEQIDARAREAQRHQAQPFDRLADRLVTRRDPARNPLFDAFFALQNIDFREFRKDGLEISLELLNPGTTRFDLNLQAYARPDGLALHLEYAADLFDAASAEHLLDQYVLALADIETDAAQRWVRPRLASKATVRCPDFDF
ncbi:amino acid adenylation domain-containing protein [Streptomyces demainii]|uniref:Amino acid adenylation domain-containing protein n=1 Tax=Streptomyces demainii TaxID=588122 RepID=A0ABT9L6X3_9ACTN|nr:amino acid adenylation domain-containing protein [Streptomyces demainii]MDP9616453.1 amino acid adenylation domain-containing protein [Streptomyces demainii]